ncbi:MAG: type IV secretion system protein [Burkholderiales bacterium]
MRKAIVRLTVVAALFAPFGAGAQIPVTITSDIPRWIEFAQTALQYATVNGADVQKIAQLQQSVNQLVRTYNQAVQTYNSLTGTRSVAGLLPYGLSDRQYLPSTYDGVVSTALPGYTGPQYGSVGTRIGTTSATNAVLTYAAIRMLPPEMQKILTAARQLAAVAQVIGEVSGERSAGRNIDYQQFMTAAAACPDLKCAADLSNRMQAEELFLKNNELQMRALENSLRAEQFALEQQRREVLVQMNGSIRDLGPVPHR